MVTLAEWRAYAYGTSDHPHTKAEDDKIWKAYFEKEMGVYQTILKDKAAGLPAYTGTVAQLAEKFDIPEAYMVGFLDGINDSLLEQNDLENMTEETVMSIDFDPEKLYYNMVAYGGKWLRDLEEWNLLLSEEQRTAITKQEHRDTQVIVGKKIGRNDPCPCGSGKKYKQCCGRNAK